MAQTVKITYSSPGLKPPVFVITSLTEPQWQPIEMDFAPGEGGIYHFSKDFEATEGQYQYKFRLGHGDWWVFDEEKPTIEDGLGNKNNLLVVEAPKKREEMSGSTTTAPPSQHGTNTRAEIDTALDDSTTGASIQGASTAQSNMSNAPQPEEDEDSEGDDGGEEQLAPLLKHEMGPVEDSKGYAPSPLLEIPSPSDFLGKSQPEDVLSPEPDQADQAILEKFPEDRDGIMESIRRVSTNIPPDEVSDLREEAMSRSRALSSASSSLPSVQEELEDADSEPTPAIAGAETPKNAATEDSNTSRPAEPMTPPLTPKDEGTPRAPTEVQDSAEEEALAQDDEEDTPPATSISTPKPSVYKSVRHSTTEDAKNKGFLAAFLDILLGVEHWFSRLCGGRAGATAVLVGISVGLAAGAWKLWMSEQNGFVFEKPAIFDRLREFNL